MQNSAMLCSLCCVARCGKHIIAMHDARLVEHT